MIQTTLRYLGEARTSRLLNQLITWLEGENSQKTFHTTYSWTLYTKMVFSFVRFGNEDLLFFLLFLIMCNIYESLQLFKNSSCAPTTRHAFPFCCLCWDDPSWRWDPSCPSFLSLWTATELSCLTKTNYHYLPAWQ
jgi:hypothetical protein